MNTTTTEKARDKRGATSASAFTTVETINFPHFSKTTTAPEVTADNYPLGSQGSVTTVADRYYEPFDIMRATTTTVVPKESTQDFKHFTGKRVTIAPERKVKKSKEQTQSKLFLLAKKDKAAVAVYSAVVIFLLALIIATGFTVSALQKNVASLERGVAEARNTNVQLTTEITVESNDSVIMDKAEQIGMVQDADIIEVELVPASDPIEYTANTNWFDKLCDFLSGVFG